MPRVDHEFIPCVPRRNVCREQSCELITCSLLVYVFPLIIQVFVHIELDYSALDSFEQLSFLFRLLKCTSLQVQFQNIVHHNLA